MQSHVDNEQPLFILSFPLFYLSLTGSVRIADSRFSSSEEP